MRKQEDPNSIPVEDAVLVHYGASLNALHIISYIWAFRTASIVLY